MRGPLEAGRHSQPSFFKAAFVPAGSTCQIRPATSAPSERRPEQQQRDDGAHGRHGKNRCAFHRGRPRRQPRLHDGDRSVPRSVGRDGRLSKLDDRCVGALNPHGLAQLLPSFRQQHLGPVRLLLHPPVDQRFRWHGDPSGLRLEVQMRRPPCCIAGVPHVSQDLPFLHVPALDGSRRERRQVRVEVLHPVPCRELDPQPADRVVDAAGDEPIRDGHYRRPLRSEDVETHVQMRPRAWTGRMPVVRPVRRPRHRERACHGQVRTAKEDVPGAGELLHHWVDRPCGHRGRGPGGLRKDIRRRRGFRRRDERGGQAARGGLGGRTRTDGPRGGQRRPRISSRRQRHQPLQRLSGRRTGRRGRGGRCRCRCGRNGRGGCRCGRRCVRPREAGRHREPQHRARCTPGEDEPVSMTHSA
jgi:hypothetical protein